MIDIGGTGRRRVLVPPAVDGGAFLRVTWHEELGVLVISHWNGDRCVAATPIRVADAGDLAELVVAAIARSAGDRPLVWNPWPAPDAVDLVATSAPVGSRGAA